MKHDLNRTTPTPTFDLSTLTRPRSEAGLKSDRVLHFLGSRACTAGYSHPALSGDFWALGNSSIRSLRSRFLGIKHMQYLI